VIHAATTTNALAASAGDFAPMLNHHSALIAVVYIATLTVLNMAAMALVVAAKGGF